MPQSWSVLVLSYVKRLRKISAATSSIRNCPSFKVPLTRSQPDVVFHTSPGLGSKVAVPYSQEGSIWRFLSNSSISRYKYSLSEEVARDLGLAQGKKPGSGFLKSIVFCSGLSVAAFTAAALWEESNYRKEWGRFKDQPFFSKKRNATMPAWVARLPAPLQDLYRDYWHVLSPVQQAVGGIVAVNAAVFAAFRTPSLYTFMVKNFLHHLPPLPSRTITLLTSNFAHSNTWHLLFNMIALWSFGREAARILGVEQFMGFYVSAGLMSALASHLGRVRSTVGGFSMGASGAVYACFALTAMNKPNTEVVFILMPWLPLKIGDVLNVMIALDIAGALLGWKRFDHFGHLGGALFGLYYALRGQQEVWPKFQKLADDLSQGGEADY